MGNSQIREQDMAENTVTTKHQSKSKIAGGRDWGGTGPRLKK